MKKRIVILGAGAAGLMAAIKAGETGAEVVVLEHTDAIGKKLLMTGNGRCNYTNTDLSLSHFHSISDPDKTFIGKALSSFGYGETIEFFRSLGIEPRIRRYGYDDGGYVYPASGEARSVLKALKSEADFLNVKFYTGCRVRSVAYMKDQDGRPVFHLDTNLGMIRSDSLIIAAGGKAMPKTGSDGSGYELPATFGHRFWEFMPSLCALRCVGSFFRDIKGVRCDCRLKLLISPPDEGAAAVREQEHRESPMDIYGFLQDDMLKETYEAYGEVQFTDYGVSGIPAFQLSRYVSLAVKLRRERYILLDVMPDMEPEELLELLYRRRDKFSDRNADILLNGLLPEKLAFMFLSKAGIKTSQGVYFLTDQTLEKLAKLLKGLRISVLDTNGFDSCQCCAGGLDTTELDPSTMESELMQELFFAGELIDVDGDCGGYNLQWAWTSGAIAGTSAGKVRRYRNYPEIFPTNSTTYQHLMPEAEEPHKKKGKNDKNQSA